MPSPTEVDHQEKEKDVETEELTEGRWQPSKAPPHPWFWSCLLGPGHRGYQLSHGQMRKKQPRLGFISKVSRLLKSIDVLTNEADIQREERLHA